MSWWNRSGGDRTEVKTGPDGSQTVVTEMTLGPGSLRPVRDEVVRALDDALEGLGGRVMHAMDPTRIKSFREGGPPVWSVAMVDVPGPTPYTLLLTYGFSGVLSPEPFLQGIGHEYSLALPAGTNPSPWADALLRHLCRYVLTSGNDLRVGDVMGCRAPLTCVPFQPAHHGMMPTTSLEAIVTATDPVLPQVSTPHGPIEVRRFLGLDGAELDRAETWSGEGFVREYAKRDPLLLTALDRPSAMSDQTFRAAADERARAEGSSIGALGLDVFWEDTGNELVIEWPGERQAQKLLDALHGRLGFGRPLLVASRSCPPVRFEPAERFDIQWSPQGLTIAGTLDEPNLARIVSFIRPDAPGSVVRLPLSR